MITKTTKTLLGKTVQYYTLSNDFMRLTFIDHGATIVDWQVKTQDKPFESIVLKYANDEDYIKNPKFLGSTVGPYAGRIYPARIDLNQKSYPLEKNFNDHANLHSASLNLMHHTYSVKVIDDFTISFKTHLSDKHYPSDTTFTLTFTLDKDTLHQVYETNTLVDTFTNLTNHTYFNLSGDIKTDVLDHTLTMQAKYVGKLDQNFMSESLMNPKDTLYDFSKEKPLKEAVLPLKNTPQLGLDHPFLLSDQTIILKDPLSKRTLTITTNQECVVVYSNNFLISEPLNQDITDRSHLSICLETQHYPNDIHFLNYPKSFHEKNTTHIQKTSYKIGVAE
ncbi:MAG: hypothetical protein ACLFRI_01545 [Candidatus Izemoplasmataceae bacterium]